MCEYWLCLVQVVKLSDAVQELPRSVTEFVHGVPESFLKVGEAKAKAPEDGEPRFSKGAYFIGKVSCFLASAQASALIWGSGHEPCLSSMEPDHPLSDCRPFSAHGRQDSCQSLCCTVLISFTYY